MSESEDIAAAAPPDTQRAMGLGRGHQRTRDGRVETERDLDVGPAGELQDRPRVDAHLDGPDVARDAGHGPDVGFV